MFGKVIEIQSLEKWLVLRTHKCWVTIMQLAISSIARYQTLSLHDHENQQDVFLGKVQLYTYHQTILTQLHLYVRIFIKFCSLKTNDCQLCIYVCTYYPCGVHIYIVNFWQLYYTFMYRLYIPQEMFLAESFKEATRGITYHPVHGMNL